MLLEIILALAIGVLSGTLTGLIPGLHINLIATIILTTNITKIQTTPLIIYIVALSITHTFIEFIPSIYLGAASEETSLSILPGHKYLLDGKAHEALKLTLIGSAIAIIMLTIILPTLYIIIKTSYNFIEKILGLILFLILILLISQEKKQKLPYILIIITLAATLGATTLNSNTTQPLLPLLTGLFGASTIINSITTKTHIPEQKITKLKLKTKQLIKPALITTLISPICSFLPGLGASQAARISQAFSKKQTTKEFLILLGSINTLIISISFFTLYLIGRKRTGSAIAISTVQPTLTPNHLAIILTTIIITSIIAFFIANKISKKISKHINKINYKKISLIVLVFLTITIILITKTQGFFIYITAASLGLLTIKIGISKSHLMSSILIPTMLYYLPI